MGSSLISMSDVPRILKQIEAGDPAAANELLPLVYDERRKLAAARMAAERHGTNGDRPSKSGDSSERSTHIQATVQRLVTLYESTNRTEEATRWRARLPMSQAQSATDYTKAEYTSCFEDNRQIYFRKARRCPMERM